MKFFYLSSKSNDLGKFEIHERECDLIPSPLDRDYLGPFNNGEEALRRGLELNTSAALCGKCCKSSFKAVFFDRNSKIE
jgi:hypothetical protein